ncbi:alpha-(1,3)-fucosyltransferase 11-like [Pectinophora gossypiella]|uniref:alpha-(1,3)-fucosyltransferase 11-like n=1 Tax=Pectinophora gossypiella TaxID=13191 RepID=UPI00214F32F1|nr:alpha-(1,3)-fucosyltransferase 11-like [Pectinophora gossypiella]
MDDTEECLPDNTEEKAPCGSGLTTMMMRRGCRYSDVPMTLYWVRSLDFITNTEYYVNTSTKNSLLSELAPVMYMQSDCDTATERDHYVKKLMEYIKVDSYGACLNNKRPPPNYMTSDDYLNQLHDIELMQFIGRYKFAVTIENGVCNDYMTEKLWRTIAAGVVPIYLGSPSVRDWLPNPKSAILLEDFPTPELMSRHLFRLLHNDTEYEEYLQHKIDQVITNDRLIDELVSRPFQTDLTIITAQFECLVCRRLHDNSSRVDIVVKSHCDCPMPLTALTLAPNKAGCWYRNLLEIEKEIDALYDRIMNTTMNESTTLVI